MSAIRAKSIALTKYLEDLLLEPSSKSTQDDYSELFKIITPSNPAERGAQLSLQLSSGLLEGVLKILEDAGVVVDERKPDVVRVAPAPLYNTYSEVWDFVQIFRAACCQAQMELVDDVQDAKALEGNMEKDDHRSDSISRRHGVNGAECSMPGEAVEEPATNAVRHF